MNSLQALLEVLVLGLLSELHTSVFVHRVQKCWACPVNYVRGSTRKLLEHTVLNHMIPKNGTQKLSRNPGFSRLNNFEIDFDKLAQARII